MGRISDARPIASARTGGDAAPVATRALRRYDFRLSAHFRKGSETEWASGSRRLVPGIPPHRMRPQASHPAKAVHDAAFPARTRPEAPYMESRGRQNPNKPPTARNRTVRMGAPPPVGGSRTSASVKSAASKPAGQPRNCARRPPKCRHRWGCGCHRPGPRWCTWARGSTSRFAVAKHVFTKPDDTAWRRLVRPLRERHCWTRPCRTGSPRLSTAGAATAQTFEALQYRRCVLSGVLAGIGPTLTRPG